MPINKGKFQKKREEEMKVKGERMFGGLVAQLCPTLVIPWTVGSQTPLSMGFPNKITGVGCHFLLQGIFLTQVSNPGLRHCRQILFQLGYQGSSDDIWSQSIKVKTYVFGSSPIILF